MQITQKLAERQKDFANHAPVLTVALGDSVTHGCFEVFLNEQGNIDTRCDAQSSYAHMLEERLNALYPYAAATVLNAGVSGDNAVNGLKRLERDVLRFRPDLVTVNFALNDSMNPDVEKGIKAYSDAMTQIFEKVLATGAQCILVTPNFMCKYVSSALTDKLLRDIAESAAKVQNEGILTQYVEAARKCAWKCGVPVADAYRCWENLDKNGVDTTALLANHINHPSKAAHGIFLDAISEVLFG